MDALHSDVRSVPGMKRETARLILSAGGLDPDAIVAEGDGRRDGAHAGNRRQAEAEALERAHERPLLHDRLSQGRARQTLDVGAKRHVLGPEEDLHPARRVRDFDPSGERELHRPEPHAVRRVLAHHQVGRAEERGDELRFGTQVELVRRPRLQQAAEAQHRQTVGQLEGLFLVVGDEDRGNPELALDLANGAAKLATHLGVERAERLVEEQHLRAMRQRAGECDPLLLSAGELARHPAMETGEADQLQQLVPAAAALGARDAADGESELDVLRHRHATKQGIGLEDEAHAALGGRHVGHVAAVQQDPPGVHFGQARDHTQQRALAAARRAQQNEELTIANFKRNAVHDRLAAVALGQLLQDDGHASLLSNRSAAEPRIRSSGDSVSRIAVTKPAGFGTCPSFRLAPQRGRPARAQGIALGRLRIVLPFLKRQQPSPLNPLSRPHTRTPGRGEGGNARPWSHPLPLSSRLPTWGREIGATFGDAVRSQASPLPGVRVCGRERGRG